MQTVLSIDLSSEIAHAVVASIEGKNVQILEMHSLAIGELAAKPTTVSQDATAPATDLTDPGITEPQSADSEVVTASNPSTALNSLSDLIKKISSPWTNAILVIPTRDYISLNIELPFGESKNINRILDLEVQDLVPFDVSDFLINHKSLAPLADDAKRFDIHVGIIPKAYIKEILAKCKAASFEPMVVTTPSSILSSIYSLAPDYFEDNSAILLERLPNFYLLTSIDGHVRSERTLRHPSFDSFNGEIKSNGNHEANNVLAGTTALLTDLKLTLASTERRYDKNLDKIYYIGERFSSADLQEALGRNVQQITIEELVPLNSKDSGIATLGAILVEDSRLPQVLSNFRVREFSYSPQLKELFRGLRALAPFLGVLLASFLVYLLFSYFITQYHISRLNSAVRTQIETALPNLPNDGTDKIVALQGQNQQLEDQLKDISSLSSLTPLDLFSEISRDIPPSLGVSITSIKIKENKVVLDGTAKDYADIEKIAKILKKNPSYRRVENGNARGSTATSARAFSFEIWVGE